MTTFAFFLQSLQVNLSITSSNIITLFSLFSSLEC